MLGDSFSRRSTLEFIHLLLSSIATTMILEAHMCIRLSMLESSRALSDLILGLDGGEMLHSLPSPWS
jgi:hypothetical protein